MKKNCKKNKNGMTLVEMLVTITIFAICIEGITLFFIKNWQSRSFILEEGQSTLIVSRAVDGIIKDLRKIQQPDNGGFPIKSGDDFDLVVFFDADNDGKVEKVHYFLENNFLKKGISKASGNPPVYPDGDENVKEIARNIVNGSDNPIFFYYNKDYPGDSTHNPLITPINIYDARLMKIHLMINIDPSRAPDNVNLESFVQFRNMNDYMQ